MTRKDVDQLGSPIFHIEIGNIADGAFEVHNLAKENSQYAKYLPYDHMEITNLSALFLTLTLNDVHEFALPGNVSLSKDDIAFNRFRITNDSGSALTGTDLYVSVQHTPLTEDKLIRRPESFAAKVKSAIPLAGLLMR